MRLTLGFFLLFVATPAFAMGSYTNHDLVAWSSDGASALVRRTSSGSATAGVKTQYVLVSAGEKKPLVVSFDDTQDPDKATQHVDAAACVKAVDKLESALAAKKFRGVTLRREQCKSKRDVVTVSVDAARDAALSWVANAVSRTASPRETASWKAAKIAVKDYAGNSASVANSGDVATMTGQLVLVFFGQNGDSSGSAHVAVASQTKDSYDKLIEDLRSVE